MKKQHSFVILFVMLIFLGLAAGTSYAQGLDIYTNPGGNGTEDKKPPSGGGNGWTQVPPGNTITVPGNGTIYIACRNVLVQTNKKTFRIEFFGVGVSFLKPTGEGFEGDDTSKPVKTRLVSGDLRAGYRLRGYRFYPQPAWERITLVNTSSKTRKITIKARSKCDISYCSAGTYSSTNAYFNAVGAVSAPLNIREIYIFPHHVGVNTDMPASFWAHSSAPWGVEWVFADPDGESRPLGGIRFFALETGLETGEQYDAEFSLLDGLESMFDLYAFDYESGQYLLYTQDVSHYTTLPDPTYGDGDANRDNIVDYVDLDIAYDNLGNDEATWADGDMDGDGDVDDIDIGIIITNLGRTY